ncbi:hypothetical protein [Paenibacillus polymyxa]|uniref:hypothetical protein n=1 Tax=Paenibacillus polymyxa TaxID=1406 RepID=UPI000D8D8333|nr:hypothetical protein [Paenibacillus polymyxa]KAE8558924.1 hypothetical protein BJH92_17070 [Paenibacillus polymyxa]MCJ1218630.1 hypothetical protein [Paenibacillus polymyxa]MDU8675125.1 hypothetical protein [Paenibacillus polymyxa]MDU8700032.1 hypothetical protein [Paenibacillus polymyxa]UQQ36703.1 hypothetical protein LMH85_07255 [Paenibacillus polymyxa]
MTESVIELERVSMVQGPYDYPHMYEIFEGVLYDCQYFFYLENGILCLRHVKKVEQSYHTHLYLDGESGGLQLAEGVQGEVMQVVTEIIERLRAKDGLTFLFDELLWLHGRGPIELNLFKKR